MKRVFFISAIAILIIVEIIFMKQRLEFKSKMDELERSYNNLVQERGYKSWDSANIAPDSIYFVTFGKDTVWYYRK